MGFWPCRLILIVSCLAYSPTLKMEAICSSETLGSLRTTRRYNPDDRILHSYRHENLKSESYTEPERTKSFKLFDDGMI
jgi:hypothetical protein